ncbi:MAG: SpoIIE family protein phosphatase [Planctomycetaceae bacterium]|nr:SpoIIE family protein phosphatase [Planctomycetaceae bacterium]
MLLLDQAPVDIPGLRIAAATTPSRKVDGDFYAFHRHDHQHLDVIIADVMGKGIPAALLGAATRSQLLEALCHLLALPHEGRLPAPHEIVTLAQSRMAQHLLDLESFVTLGYLRFDLGCNRIEFVDCGHTGLIRRSVAAESSEMIHGANLPLGFRVGEIYKQLSVPFEVGDLFLLFSDGVTETRNPDGELFGEGRLLECVERNRTLEPTELIQAIRGATSDFSRSETHADDWTCVAVKVVDRPEQLARAELDIRSNLGELRRARELIRTVCRGLTPPPLDDEGIAQLELAVTEACSNVMKHAYRGEERQAIHLEVEVDAQNVSVLVHHLGPPFDPSTVPLPAFDGSQVSGFGVYLIAQSVDSVRYSQDERGRNCIALVKHRRDTTRTATPVK